MIKKSLLAAFIFFSVHALFVLISQPLPVSQHQWQDNLVKAQQFIYTENTPSVVIIGSSLSSRLSMDSLPESVYNLAFNGGSIYEGLKIISQKDKLPKVVYVEMNVALRKENKKLLDMLYQPILYHLKKFLPSLRDGYQPAGLCLNVIKGAGPSRLSRKNSMDSVDDLGINEDLFKKLLDGEIADNLKVPEDHDLAERFELLKRYIDLLQKKGVKVVFYEIPMNPALQHSARLSSVREAFYKYFSPKQFAYLIVPDWSGYHTTDGEHLRQSEALQYTLFLKSQMERDSQI